MKGCSQHCCVLLRHVSLSTMALIIPVLRPTTTSCRPCDLSSNSTWSLFLPNWLLLPFSSCNFRVDPHVPLVPKPEKQTNVAWIHSACWLLRLHTISCFWYILLSELEKPSAEFMHRAVDWTYSTALHNWYFLKSTAHESWAYSIRILVKPGLIRAPHVWSFLFLTSSHLCHTGNTSLQWFLHWIMITSKWNDQ